jgi:hypothetical protein
MTLIQIIVNNFLYKTSKYVIAVPKHVDLMSSKDGHS